jgi:hypothetical protein
MPILIPPIARVFYENATPRVMEKNAECGILKEIQTVSIT